MSAQATPGTIYIVWANGWPIAAYVDPELGMRHARVMLGVIVTPLEIRTRLPENVEDDINSDYDGDDDTPVIPLDDIDGDSVVIDVDDLT